MKKLLLLLATVLAVGAPASAKDYHRHYTHHAAGYYPGDYYTNRAGHQVHRPVRANSAPPGASAKCYDGTYSFSENHRGTCSHHGGVASWL